MAVQDQLPMKISQRQSLLDMQKLEASVYPIESQSSSHLPGVILVSIDVEYVYGRKNCPEPTIKTCEKADSSFEEVHYDSRGVDIDQIGLATLASTALLKTSSDDIESRKLVASHLFLLKRRYIPRNTHARQYTFGTAESITAANLSDTLAAILTPIDKNLRVVLVGHDIKADLLAIKRYCGLDLRALPCVKMTIDTVYIPSYLYDLECRKVSLKHTCRLVGIHARQLHNAGNDAYYTLKVLILLFRRYNQREIMRGLSLSDPERRRATWEQRLQILERIGKDNTFVSRPPKRIRDIESRHHNQLYGEHESVFGLAAFGNFDDV